MNRKTISKINGSIAIYYGIGGLVGAIGGVIGIIVWLYRIFTDQIVFSWEKLIGLIIITSLCGLIGYSIFRVGQEEVEDSNH